MEKEHPLFSEEFAHDASRNRLWNTFLKRIGINEVLDFKDVLAAVVMFLEPIYQSILREHEFFGKWNAAEKIWSKPDPSNMSVF